MFCPIRMPVRTSDPYFRDGFTLMEVMIAMTIAIIGLLGAYTLILSISGHYRDSAAMTDMYSDSRIAVERLFRDLSETSSSTVVVKTTDVRSAEGFRDDAISFASARGADGTFQLGTYGAFNFVRPIHQKAIIYYLLYGADNGTGGYSKKLYRKEILKTDWDDNYDPTWAMDENGEVIARNVDYMYFGSPYPEVDPEVTQQDHVLDVSIGFLRSLEQMEAGPERTVKVNTGIPMMNRGKK